MSAASHLALVKDDDIKIAPIIFPGPLVRVGRWRGNVELLLDDKGQATMASRIHAELRRCESTNTWTVHDKSANGCFLNGHRVEADGCELKCGDRLGFGTSFDGPAPVDGMPPEMPRFHFRVVRAPSAVHDVLEDPSLLSIILEHASTDVLSAAALMGREWLVESQRLWEEHYGGLRRFGLTDRELIARVTRGFRACAGVSAPVVMTDNDHVTSIALGGAGDDRSVLLTAAELLSLVPRAAHEARGGWRGANQLKHAMERSCMPALHSFRVQCAHRLLEQTDQLWASGLQRVCASPALRTIEIVGAGSLGDEAAIVLASAMSSGALRSLSSLALVHTAISPAGAQQLIDSLPHAPALAHVFGGGGVRLGSLGLFAWAKERWGTPRPELDLFGSDGTAMRFLLNFTAPIDADWEQQPARRRKLGCPFEPPPPGVARALGGIEAR